MDFFYLIAGRGFAPKWTDRRRHSDFVAAARRNAALAMAEGQLDGTAPGGPSDTADE